MDNSEASTVEDRDDYLSEGEKNTRIFATQMLKGRVFLGHFQEKRHVEPLQAYRDVVVVHDAEDELKKDIDIVRRRLREYYGHSCWIGLTGPEFIGAPHGHCIWVESKSNPLGSYWYKIREVRFRSNEIRLRVKIIRAMKDSDGSQQAPFANLSMGNIFDNFSFDALFDNIKNSAAENAVWFFTTVLTVSNVKAALTFISVLLATGVALMVKVTGYFMEFSLRFMREFSYFVHASTPVMIAVVNLIGKIVGGFYLLIAMIWRDSTRPSQYTPYRAIAMPKYNNRPSLTITEID